MLAILLTALMLLSGLSVPALAEETPTTEPTAETEATAPKTADELAAMGMTTEELAEALEMSVDEVEALSAEEISELHMALQSNEVAPMAVSVSEPSASSKILIYDQYGGSATMQEWQKKALSGNATLSDSGCGLYTYAHAIQWLTGISRNLNNGGELLDELIEVNSTPWASLEKFRTYITNTYGARLVDRPYSETALLDHFSNGGVIVDNPGGHYVLTVGAVRADIDGDGTSELWLHIVDSACGSTMYRLCNKGYCAYTFDKYEKLDYITQTQRYGWDHGGEYWVSYTAYNACMRKLAREDKAYLPGNYSGYTTAAYEDAVYKVIKSSHLKDAPYADANTIGSVAVNDTINVIALVKNKYDNIWMKTSDGKFIYSGYAIKDGSYVQTGTQYLQLSSDKVNGSATGIAVPSGNLVQGKSFELRGVINCSNSIQKIVATVTGTKSDSSQISYSSTLVTSENIYTSSVNTGLKFGSLPNGNYKFELRVYYYYDRMQKVGSYVPSGCSTTFTVGNGSSNVAVTGISLSNSSLSLTTGESATLTATVSPRNASNKNVTWTSSNASVATVSNGTVKAVSPGTATITCTAADGSGKTAKCTVTVNAVKHYLDVNGWLDGETSGDVNNYGTFDVYINGSLVKDDVSDYYTEHPEGTTFEIRDIKALAGHQYNGVYSGSTKGTISDSSVIVSLSFSTTYTVSFNANGGTGAPAAQTKVKNAALTLSSVKPTRSGYTFMGWATTSTATAAQYQPGDSYTNNSGVTLYAVWQRDKIYVTQISLSQTELTMEMGDAQTLTATVLPGNADNPALAWTTSNESVATVSNGTVTAVGPGTAKIVCSATDGSGVSAVCTVTVNEAHSHTIAMDRPILATKTENGLSIGLRCRTCNEIMLPQKSVGSDRILALPNALKTIDDEAFVGADMQQIVIPDGTTRIGSRAFAGCGELLLVSIPKDVNSIADDAFEGCDTQYFCIVAEDGSYAAQYAETNGLYHCDPKGRFTVTLDARGGKCGTEGFTAEVGKPLGTLPVPTRNGYSFDGWYDEGDSPVNEDTVVNDSIGSLTLHAKWYSVITFNANGGSCNTASMNVYEGQAIGTLPAASRENYTFNGWYTAASGGVKAEATTEFDGATTLYAQWTRKTCTITYNANGGVCTTGSRTLNCGDAIGTLPVPTRDYYTFNGWYTAASGGTKIATTTTFTSSATLYAQWTANAYSGWVTESSVPSNARIVDSKTQYQYRDTTYTTVYSDWSGWSDWTITRESTSDLKKEESATVYGWYWFQCPNCGRHWHVYSGLAIDCSKTWGPGDGCGGDNIQSTDHHIVWSTTPWSSGTSNWYGTGRTCLDTGAYTRMFAWTDGGSARTGYRYATRTSSQKANVGAWSAWSDTVYTASSTREVATRKLVRYQLK